MKTAVSRDPTLPPLADDKPEVSANSFEKSPILIVKMLIL